ncbi:MAG: undecaprenyl-diphosphatase [Bacteroidetes bacterium]|nr:undecaprenyl-diphosphatase [Bacteroidota bacterium]
MPLTILVLVAVVQGLTEFLPVSSSGHLALIPLLTDAHYQGRAIDVAAHVGTLGAVLWFLRRDLIELLLALLPASPHSPLADTTSPDVKRSRAASRRLIAALILATLPVILVGFAVNKLDPDWLTDIHTLALANLIFAAALWYADRKGGLAHGIADMQMRPALIIGLVQCLALIPGASRSGVTMTAARYLGFDRVGAARFSLLLSIPAIGGAGLLKGIDIISAADVQLGIDAAIVAVLSFGFALAAISWMMRWLTRADFTIFVWYRLGLGAALLLAIFAGVI